MPKTKKEFLDLLKYFKEIRYRNKNGQWTKEDLNKFRNTIESCIRIAENDSEKRIIAPAVYCWNRCYLNWQKYFPDLRPLNVVFDPPSFYDIPDKVSVALKFQEGPRLSQSDLDFLERLKIPAFNLGKDEMIIFTDRDLRFLKIARISPG